MRILTILFVALIVVWAGCSDETGPTSETGGDDLRSVGDDRGQRDSAGGGDADDSGGGDDGAGGDAIEDGATDVTSETDTAEEDGRATDLNTGTDTGGGDTGGGDTTHCATTSTAWTGTLVTDFTGDPIAVGDRLKIEVEVFTTPAVGSSMQVVLEVSNLEWVGDVRFNGSAIHTPGRLERPLRLNFDTLDEGIIEIEANVLADDELITVFSSIQQSGVGCTIPRSESGAMLQVVGGEFKNPYCVDMAHFRSLQVAPSIRKRPLTEYLEANGAREDLLVDEFIFCPQAPTVVHAAEFCIQRAPNQDVAFAGHYDNDAMWEVDDFMFVEVFDERGELLDDGFTTQSHGGDPTIYWCAETSTNMCTTGCTAALHVVADDRAVTPLSTVSAQGATPRQMTDGDVVISGLLANDGSRQTIRITALDTGVDGLLDPQLFLVSEEP